MSKMALLIPTDSWQKMEVIREFLSQQPETYWRSRLNRTSKYLSQFTYPLNLYFYHRNVIRYRATCTDIIAGNKEDWPLSKIPPRHRPDPKPYKLALVFRRLQEIDELPISTFPTWDNPHRRFDRGILGLLKAIDVLTSADEQPIENMQQQSVVSFISQGAGFGTPETNRKVEKTAVAFVKDWYEGQGWTVKSVERQKVGFDLVCLNGKVEEHVEVKGIQGSALSFIVTNREYQQANEDPRFVICIVTSALSGQPSLTVCRGKEFLKQFVFKPLAYMVSRQP